MKNIFFLGNGFDLFYNLPTRYSNFLHMVDFLTKQYNSSMQTIGDVFRNQKLQSMDKFIEEIYHYNKATYDASPLDKNAVNELIKLSRTNMWFNYFIKSFNKDIGWIDFEREISTVVHSFKKTTQNLTPFFDDRIFPSSKIDKYIIQHFDFYYETNSTSFQKAEHKTYKVKDEYLFEYPSGTGILQINIEKLIKTLYYSLQDFSKSLQLYLKIFVESPLSFSKNLDNLTKYDIFLDAYQVISLNYTSTFEKLYSNDNVIHLHGDTEGNIVLGINPDESDLLETIDTSFIEFKKYYQRTLYESDLEYLRWLTNISNTVRSDLRLIVMGHSLDITDQDVIQDLFKTADNIVVLYHDSNAKASYIKNLVNIFGKFEFDDLKRHKNLKFIPLSNLSKTN